MTRQHKQKIRCLSPVLLKVLISTACAQPCVESLMLSPSERMALEKIPEYSDTDKDTISSEEDILIIDAIMFFDANRWTFWLNQKPITPNTIPNHIQIHHVRENEVCLSLKGKKEKITLLPNEKYTKTPD